MAGRLVMTTSRKPDAPSDVSRLLTAHGRSAAEPLELGPIHCDRRSTGLAGALERKDRQDRKERCRRLESLRSLRPLRSATVQLLRFLVLDGQPAGDALHLRAGLNGSQPRDLGWRCDFRIDVRLRARE